MNIQKICMLIEICDRSSRQTGKDRHSEPLSQIDFLEIFTGSLRDRHTVSIYSMETDSYSQTMIHIQSMDRQSQSRSRICLCLCLSNCLCVCIFLAYCFCKSFSLDYICACQSQCLLSRQYVCNCLVVCFSIQLDLADCLSSCSLPVITR